MKHQFFGGPLNGKVLLLDVLLGDQELRENVPWEEYDRIAFGDAETGELALVQWRHRSIEASEVPAPVITDDSPEAMRFVPQQDPVDGGWPLVPVMISPGYEGSVRVPVEMAPAVNPADIAPAPTPEVPPLEPEGSSEAPADSARVIDRPEDSSAPDAKPELEHGDWGTLPGESDDFDLDEGWRTFEERRKALKISRDKLGIDIGGTKSLGWRLESGNVSNGDVKKLGLGSVSDVYVAAHRLLISLEAGV